jgi:hypothetical protein
LRITCGIKVYYLKLLAYFSILAGLILCYGDNKEIVFIKYLIVNAHNVIKAKNPQQL